jgi:SAM-dependent methyltransferase
VPQLPVTGDDRRGAFGVLAETTSPPRRSHWEREAANWITWTRKPGHDPYWHYSPAFFHELVPRRATLEIACGEGRVVRDLTARGHRTTGADASGNLIAAARAADPAGTYLHADATALPFDDAAFDLVVIYNALMDVDDMPGAVAEAARVLEAGGHLCVSVTHPVFNAGRFDGDGADAPFVIEGSYLGDRRRFEAVVEEDGVQMRFAGWADSLEAYTRPLEAAGLLIERLREPRVPASYGRRTPSGEDLRWDRIPMFLWFRALKPA